MRENLLYDHMTAKLSDLDMEMVRAIPPGGNWKNIPDETVMKSKRLQQIRKSGGRTTYYGRLLEDKPSYTINTYFTRPGNGTFIHPRQDRLISLREGARLQSFPDSFRFFGSKPSKYKQIGNAVPPLLAKAVAGVFSGKTAIDLFAGAGGLSWGIREAGFECLVAADFDKNMCETLRNNGDSKEVMQLDMTAEGAVESISENVENQLHGRQLDLCAGGPPCQGFSTAGNWDKTDPRNNLFKPFLEVVGKLEPRNVLIENVPGIKSMLKGEILQKIQEMLQEMEYKVKWIQLKAEAFGVPQLRRRVFIFATLNDKRISYPDALFAPKGDPTSKLTDTGDFFVLPKPVTVWDAISELPPLEHGQGEDCVEYDSDWPQSNYQRWLRGQISLNDLYASYGVNQQ
jgi:DNA (cytosine-5)-methyltransferase 1